MTVPWTNSTTVYDSGLELVKTVYDNGKEFEGVEIPTDVLVNAALAYCKSEGMELDDAGWYVDIGHRSSTLNRRIK